MITATALSLRDSARRHALDHFLHRLKKWARAYSRDQSDVLPDHRIEWFTRPDDGPEKVIGDAMKELPALWLGALPDGVVIVPRRMLEKNLGLSPETIDMCSAAGMHYVDAQAARLQNERIKAQYT